MQSEVGVEWNKLVVLRPNKLVSVESKGKHWSKIGACFTTELCCKTRTVTEKTNTREQLHWDAGKAFGELQ